MNLKRAIVANRRRAAAAERDRERTGRAFLEKSLGNYFRGPAGSIDSLFSDLREAATKPSVRAELLDGMRKRVRDADGDQSTASAYLHYLIVSETLSILNPALAIDDVGQMCRRCGFHKSTCSCGATEIA